MAIATFHADCWNLPLNPMEKVFDLASRISTPLALAGLIATAFFFVARQVLSRKIFPKLTARLSSEVIKLIINRLFILSLIAMLLGFSGFVVGTQRKIENLETLVESLYSRTCFETINGFDSGRVFIQPLGGDRKRLFLRLEHAPLKRSVQCSSGGNPFVVNSGMALLSPMGHYHNIVYGSEITGDGDLRSLTYTVQYVKDVRDTKSISKVEFRGHEVIFDGLKTLLEKIE
jgi:hypothetical protein